MRIPGGSHGIRGQAGALPVGLRQVVDGGTGSYEDTAAAELPPAARTVVGIAAAVPGEHVLDLGCGSGNAALLAAAAGVRVTEVDPAARLLQVAQARAAAAGKHVRFLGGRAESIPEPTAEVDVIVSVPVFGVVPTRRAILATPAVHGPATTMELADRLPITRQAITKHPVLPADVGLVTPDQASGTGSAVGSSQLGPSARGAPRPPRRVRRRSHHDQLKGPLR